MRDPARIDRMLSQLRELWHRYPDQRLGQLIVNVIRPGEPCPRVFYTEDGDTERKLQELLAQEVPGTAAPSPSVTTQTEMRSEANE